jgi:hypothetical protein
VNLHQHSQILFLKLIPHHKYRKTCCPLSAYTSPCLFVDQKRFGRKYVVFTTTVLNCTFSSRHLPTHSDTFPLMSNPSRPCMFIYCTRLRIRRIRQSLNLLSTLCLHTPFTSLYIPREKRITVYIEAELVHSKLNAN